MRARTLALLAIPAVLSACAATRGADAADDQRDLARALEGRVAGAPQRCLPAARSETATIVGRSLLYHDGRTTWRSDAPDCPSLDGDPILIVERFGDQLCENDRFRTVARGGIGIPGPSCRFGPFVPYTRPR